MKRKAIPNHLGYSADRSGRIWRRHKNCWIKVNPVTHCGGYQYTNVHGVKYLTQRLVCSAFKGIPPKSLPICIRKAKNQQPRRLRSQRYLRWGTHKDRKPGKCHHHLGVEHVVQIKVLYEAGETQAAIALRFGVSQSAISQILTRRKNL